MRARIWKSDDGWRLEPTVAPGPDVFKGGDDVSVSPCDSGSAGVDALAAEASHAVADAHNTVNKRPGKQPEAAAAPHEDPVDPAAAKAQLDLVLSFFGRVETKLSVVLGIDLGMFGVVFAKATTSAAVAWAPALALGAFVICQALATRELYLGSFPSLDGGDASLVYFRAAAKMQEEDYTQQFTALSKAELARDHLEQAWQNSKILTAKFDSLKRAYQWTAVSIIPWAIALALLNAGVTR